MILEPIDTTSELLRVLGVLPVPHEHINADAIALPQDVVYAMRCLGFRDRIFGVDLIVRTDAEHYSQPWVVEVPEGWLSTWLRGSAFHNFIGAIAGGQLLRGANVPHVKIPAWLANIAIPHHSESTLLTQYPLKDIGPTDVVLLPSFELRFSEGDPA